jgi:hypothetical protein
MYGFPEKEIFCSRTGTHPEKTVERTKYNLITRPPKLDKPYPGRHRRMIPFLYLTKNLRLRKEILPGLGKNKKGFQPKG